MQRRQSPKKNLHHSFSPQDLPPVSPGEPLLTVKEVAAYLGVSTSTVYRDKNKGLPYYKDASPRSRLRFKQGDVEEWLSHRKKVSFLADKTLRNILTSHPQTHIDNAEGGQTVARKKTRHNYGYGSVYVRKTKKGQSRFYLDFYDAEGKRKQEVVKNATNWTEAHEALKNAVAKEFFKESGENREKRIKFSEFSEMYLEIIKRKKRSWKTDQKFLRAQLIPFFGNMELSEITPEHVNKFIKKREKEGVKNSTVNKHLQILRRMINLSEEHGYKIDRNPVRPHHFSSEAENRRTRVMSYEDEKRLMKEAAPHLRPIIECANLEAMRLQEILQLKISDVDIETETITIRPEINKTGKLDIIPIREEMKSILKNLIDENGGRTPFVFNYIDPHTGEYRPISNIQHGFQAACRRAGIKGLQFRDLRRTCLTRLHEAGVDPLIISRFARHSSTKITTEVYIQSNLKMMKQALRKVDEKAGKNIDNSGNLLHHCYTGKKEEKEKSTIALFSMN